ncbi:MAG: hypothetical protein JWQ43_2080, partial [Glaciihabitans sp.]|nr:hypothetical protein [Glaciihabitans sp.]
YWEMIPGTEHETIPPIVELRERLASSSAPTTTPGSAL